MSERVLVCILCQTRSHELTWQGFQKNVLNELEADLALSIGVDGSYDTSNPFYRHAKFHWTAPEYADYSEAFDDVSQSLGATQDWRRLTRHKGNWIGAVEGRDGSGAILIFYRWLMMRNIIENNLLSNYDRFIVTRSDYFYWSPHPPLDILDPDFLWVPFGENHGGITDRHLIISPQDLQSSVDFLTEILVDPQQMDQELLRIRNWNIERFLYFQFKRRGLLERVKRYPYVMATVRGATEETKGSVGRFEPDEEMIIKYPAELRSARTFRDILTNKDAWRKFHAEGGFDRLDEMTPQLSRKFEARAHLGRWWVRQMLDRMGMI